MSDEKIDSQKSQGLISDAKGSIEQQYGDRQSVETGGGDSAGQNVDKSQNTFIINLLGADPTGSISQRSIQELVAALAQVTDGQSVSRAYREALPPDAAVSRSKATTLEDMVAQLEEFRKLLPFLERLAGDPNISEDPNVQEAIHKQRDEIRQQEGNAGQENWQHEPKQSSASQAYLQIVVHEKQDPDVVVNAWLIPDIAVTDPVKRYLPLDLEKSRKGVSCQIGDVQRILNQFLDKALEALYIQYYDQQYELTVEMFLPQKHLCRDVDSWKMTADHGFGKESFLQGSQYYVLVRSQERLDSRYLVQKKQKWL
ncbi:MAG: hypothetical protein ACFB5Z_04865, partial [Elainellaceae cyanobacterium]